MLATGYISADLANPFAGAAVLDECGQWLESGVSVGIFPEGTRSRDGRLGSFKPGAFRVALTHGVRVLPLVIDGSREALPRGSWTWLGESPYKSIRIKVLEPIDPAELANIEAVSLAKSCQAAVADTLAQWRDAEIEEQVWVRARAADGAVETRARADA